MSFSIAKETIVFTKWHAQHIHTYTLTLYVSNRTKQILNTFTNFYYNIHLFFVKDDAFAQTIQTSHVINTAVMIIMILT